MPNGRCRFHGGKSRKGAAHPNFRHGRRSKYELPAHLAARVEALLANDDLMAQLERLALLTAQEQQLASELTGDDETDRPTWVRLFEVQQQIVKLTELELRRRYADGIPREVVFAVMRRVALATRHAILKFEGLSVEARGRLVGQILDAYYQQTGERILPALEDRDAD